MHRERLNGAASPLEGVKTPGGGFFIRNIFNNIYKTFRLGITNRAKTMRKETRFFGAFVWFNVLTCVVGTLILPLYITLRYACWVIGLARKKKLDLATWIDRDFAKVRSRLEKISGLEKVWREHYGTSFTRMSISGARYTWWGRSVFAKY